MSFSAPFHGIACMNCLDGPQATTRGLCMRCESDPLVTHEDFPVESSISPCQSPTRAEPGSEEKIKVLAERRRLKQSLWHDLDSTDHTAIARQRARLTNADSGVEEIRWRKDIVKRFFARFVYKKKRIYLGSFLTHTEAARVSAAERERMIREDRPPQERAAAEAKWGLFWSMPDSLVEYEEIWGKRVRVWRKKARVRKRKKRASWAGSLFDGVEEEGQPAVDHT